MKNKSEFQVTIQSIPSQSAIIGWRHMAAKLKSIGQARLGSPNWCQLRLQRCSRNTGLPRRPSGRPLYRLHQSASVSGLSVFYQTSAQREFVRLFQFETVIYRVVLFCVHFTQYLQTHSTTQENTIIHPFKSNLCRDNAFNLYLAVSYNQYML